MDAKELTLSLFNLEDSDIDKIDVINNNGDMIIDIFLTPKHEYCPICGVDRLKIKQYVLKKINHAVLSDRRCTLHYHARRYECPICHKTFYEFNPFVFKGSKISTLTVMNVLKDLKNFNETFSSVANRYHISPTTAASIFDSHVHMSRLKLSEYISIDECYAFSSKEYNSKYVCMILDYMSKSPIDILPTRHKDRLLSYLWDIPKSERDNVKMVASDMYGVYRDVIKTVFPNALHIIDHYHLSAELSRVVDSIRIKVMKSLPKKNKDNKISDAYYLLKNFNWLLFKRYDSKDKNGIKYFDINVEKKYNKHFDKYLNYYDIRKRIMELDNKLYMAWDIYDDFAKLYDDNDINTISDALNELINKYDKCGIVEIQNFIRIIKSWRIEIINSFIVIDKVYKVNNKTGEVVVLDKKLNNGLIENKNAILKCIKKNSNGYLNWNRFRNRCLYVLRKDALPLLNPISKN